MYHSEFTALRCGSIGLVATYLVFLKIPATICLEELRARTTFVDSAHLETPIQSTAV